MQRERGGGQGVQTPLENHKLLYVSLSYDVASESEITPCNKIDKPLVVYGSILLNIHEVWPCPFWRGSSPQKKNTVVHFIGHIPLLHWKVIRGQIK